MRRVFALGLTILVVGCSGGATDAPAADAARLAVDAGVDASRPDGAVPDAAEPDAPTLPDAASSPDAAQPPDAETPPDAAAPTPPDAAAPPPDAEAPPDAETPPDAGPPTGFTAQVRLGFTDGDQWEPAIAADGSGHVYVLYPQYDTFPGCSTCPSPTMALLVSGDRGLTWSDPVEIAPPGTGQWDAQIVVDPIDGETVYAAWLQDNKSDVVVARSDDHGAHWSTTTADHTNAGTDKPILIARGQDVYVGYDHAQKVWVSASHDGGETFTQVAVGSKFGLSLAGGAAIDPAGNVYFSWDGYESGAGAPTHLFIGKSSDGGATWSSDEIDTSGSPPDCSAYFCGFAYLGAQITMTADAAGTLYALWNGGPVTAPGGPQRVYFASSSDQGATWSAFADVSDAPQGAGHAFPAIVAGAGGDVRIAWMDARAGTLWNTYTRSSTDGGATWSDETDISEDVPGYSYIMDGGFSYPFGDYFEMAIDDRGTTHLVWGEGLNYDTPGSIWYVRGR